MCVEAVHALDAVPPIVESLLTAELAEPIRDPRNRVRAVLARQHVGVRPGLDRCPWIQLECAPMHLDLVGEVELLPGALEPALAEPAPGTHNVGEHFDLQPRRR